MNTDQIIMVGNRSDCHSDFAVFEAFKNWRQLRTVKILPERVYFAVLTIADKKKADIIPNLMVQGYRPHSSCAWLSVDTRRYGEFVKKETVRDKVYPDDVVFSESQLYRIKGETKVELVLLSGDSYKEEKIETLADCICKERGYEPLGELALYDYECPRSAGYFLKGRNYRVWAVLVGEPTGFELRKRVLIFDYWTGIPSIVEYNDECFFKI